MKFHHCFKLLGGTFCGGQLTFTKWNAIRKLTSVAIPRHPRIWNQYDKGEYVLMKIPQNTGCLCNNLPHGIPLRFHRNKSSNSDFPYREDVLIQYLQNLEDEYNELIQSENRDKFSKRERYLQSLVTMYGEYKEKVKDRAELLELVEGSSDDKELKVLMEDERNELHIQIDELKNQLVEHLLPKETVDENDVILEVNPGVGGQEAMLFTKDIFDMYESFAQYKGWTFDIMEYDTVQEVPGSAGLRSASASISGLNVYELMKYESGVHRVQRVPKTETKGRVHTSTMTVAVLPQPKEIDIDINKNELKIETFRCSGKGGQSVNTTDSAVRITHLPTGIKSECREERSQVMNLKVAMKKLYTRIYEAELMKQITSSQQQRKIQVGSAARSEKIRTYNYNQNRITEHRIHHSMFDIEGFLSGSELLDDMIHLLMVKSRQEVLVETLENFEKLTCRNKKQQT